MPTARSLIVNSGYFSPENVNMLCGVFDDACTAVEANPQGHYEARRLVLAAAIVDLAIAGETNPDKLMLYALSRLRGYEATTAHQQRSAQGSADRRQLAF
jgi:hypothetical protein